ncbi:MAG: hypothetical protein ABUL77_00040 [Bacteroidota bacterium]
MLAHRRLWRSIAPVLPPAAGAALQRTSRTLLVSALSGLLGASTVGCESSTPRGESDPDAAVSAGIDGGTGGDTATGGDGAIGPKVTKETEGDRTFANVIAECDTRNGYAQVHAACAGTNSCAGFSYGDWDPGVTSEHTCAGMNGCNGISCVVLPADSGKTGKQIYEEKLPETGPRACTNCHGGYDDVTKAVDPTKFKVYFMPGEQGTAGGRTLANWRDKRSAAEQARIVAFGSIGRLPDGTAFSHMAAYHKLYSRAEVERLVQFIRTDLQPIEAVIKLKD